MNHKKVVIKLAQDYAVKESSAAKPINKLLVKREIELQGRRFNVEVASVSDPGFTDIMHVRGTFAAGQRVSIVGGLIQGVLRALGYKVFHADVRPGRFWIKVRPTPNVARMYTGKSAQKATYGPREAKQAVQTGSFQTRAGGLPFTISVQRYVFNTRHVPKVNNNYGTWAFRDATGEVHFASGTLAEAIEKVVAQMPEKLRQQSRRLELMP